MVTAPRRAGPPAGGAEDAPATRPDMCTTAKARAVRDRCTEILERFAAIGTVMVTAPVGVGPPPAQQG
jgi:hypothetical protein